ncbi:MAG: 5-formyltetrahydrofolate cyclo-ligase [Alphaproteobacteria bacterium]
MSHLAAGIGGVVYFVINRYLKYLLEATMAETERRAQIAAGMVRRTGIGEAMIERLVHAFHAKVRRVALLGPVFDKRIIAGRDGALLTKGQRLRRPDTEILLPGGTGGERGRDMTGRDDNDRPATYASPPCFMHEVDPAYMGLAMADDPRQRVDVMRWRKAERERLIAARLTIPSDWRRAYSEEIAANLEQAIGDAAGLTVSAYWPFRGEPDLRGLLDRVAARGGRTALPVVIARGQPLVFRAWARGEPLERGVWNIPVPAGDAEVVMPDVVIAPVVGFDPDCYRLGYGGGFFDRTLAAMATRPRVFGVGYKQTAISTIYPQSHDIPMDMVVTEDGIVEPAGTARDARRSFSAAGSPDWKSI